MERNHPLSETFVSDEENLESLQERKCERIYTHPIRRDVTGQYMTPKHNPKISKFAAKSGNLIHKVQCEELNRENAVEDSNGGLAEQKKISETKLNPDAKAFVIKSIDWSKLPLGPVESSRSLSPVSFSYDASMSEDVTSHVNDGLFSPSGAPISSPIRNMCTPAELQKGYSLPLGYSEKCMLPGSHDV